MSRPGTALVPRLSSLVPRSTRFTRPQSGSTSTRAALSTSIPRTAESARSARSATLLASHRPLISRFAPSPRHFSSVRSTTSSSSSSSSSTPTPTRPCPLCFSPIPLSASPCPSCRGLIPIPSDLTLHSLLFLTPSSPPSSSSATPGSTAGVTEIAALPGGGYDLDPRDLRARMLARQRDLHPDRHGGSDLARDLSGRVNKAYEVLADPLRRAEYLLEVYGSPTLETDSVTDPDLLMEIMEAREELEEVSDSHEEIEAIRDRNHQRVEATVADLRTAFAATPPDLDSARTLAVQLKYWVGLENAAKDKL